ncbi:MAG: hypothetical protein K0R00_3655, partial [Herbinix sp.]|nr:hypothetical protein [Herbinix sp.]
MSTIYSEKIVYICLFATALQDFNIVLATSVFSLQFHNISAQSVIQ